MLEEELKSRNSFTDNIKEKYFAEMANLMQNLEQIVKEKENSALETEETMRDIENKTKKEISEISKQRKDC